MLRVAIVDDDREDLKLLEGYLRRFFEEYGEAFEVSAFSEGDALIQSGDLAWDILFLDVEMPGSNGIEVARALRERGGSTALIFVSRIAHYAVQGYSVDAMDYILKPVEYGEFEKKLRKAVNHVRAHRARRLQIAMDGDYRWLDSDAIRYVEVFGHTLVYHTTEGDFRAPGTIGSATEALAGCHFIPCARYLLVNLKFVTGIDGNTILLEGDRLPISRRRRREIVDALLIYNGGRA